MLVNDKNIKTYSLDNKTTIIGRIASAQNTLPRYLYFGVDLGKLSINEIKDLNLETFDLLELIKKSKEGFKDFYEGVKDKYTISSEEYLELWIAFSTGFEPISFEIDVESIKNFGFIPNINILIKDKQKFVKKLTDEIIDFKKEQVQIDKKLKKLEEPSSVQSSGFSMDSIIFEIKVKTTFYSLYNIFNEIQLDSNVVFASYSNFYKVYREFIPDLDWLDSRDDKIILKVKTLKKSTEDIYRTYLIRMTEKNDMIIELQVNLGKKFYNKDELISNILRIFDPIYIKGIESEKETKIVGKFFIPKKTFNNFIFSDMCMNDPIFDMFKINDRRVVRKKKEGTFINFVNNIDPEGNLLAVATEKVVESINPMKAVLRTGDTYIQVKISKAKEIKYIEFFKSIFLKLYEIYESEFDKIAKVYMDMIPTFVVKKLKIIPEKKQTKFKLLAQRVPDLFVAEYTKSCPEEQLPTIIDPEQVDYMKEKGVQVMTFPLTESEGDIHNYICENPDFPYPGLKQNKKARNKDVYEYIPCCYTKDQTKKKGSGYNKYFHGVKPIVQKTYVYQTLKVLPSNAFGILPNVLTKLFSKIDPDSTYLRYGVNSTTSSFLECVLQAKDMKFTDISKVRNSLLDKVKLGICKQEMYDYSLERIENLIKNQEEYFDPKLFIRVLEEVYDVTIYLFEGDNLTSPRFIENYYRFTRSKDCVMIYINTNGPLRYPQCELIVSRDGDGVDQKTFSPKLEITRSVENFYEKLLNSYSLNKYVRTVDFNSKMINSIVFQYIDGQGKARLFYTGKVYFTTTPLPPLNKKVMNYTTETENKLEDVLEFLKISKLRITSQYIQEEKLVSITVNTTSVNLNFKVIPSKPLDNVPIFREIIYPSSESLLDTYYLKRKQSLFLREYFFYMFSLYCQENKVNNPNLKNITEFVNKHTKIDKAFEYGVVKDYFDIKSNGLMKGSKIILTSEELLKKLVYVLRLTLFNSKDSLLNYSKRELLEFYYEFPKDFKPFTSNIILKDARLLKNYIDTRRFSYILSISPLNITEPYFMFVKDLSENIWLCQNNDSVIKAKDVSYTWKILGYNPGYLFDDPEDKKIQYDLYLHKDSKLKGYLVDGQNPNYDVTILGYKKVDQVYFTSLLPLKK